MSNEDYTRLFRLALLRVLDEQGSHHGLTTKVICNLVSQHGFNPSVEAADKELRYLKSGDYVQLVVDDISPSIRSWETTKKGVDYLASQA